MARMLGAVGRAESERIRERVSRAHQQAKERGLAFKPGSSRPQAFQRSEGQRRTCFSRCPRTVSRLTGERLGGARGTGHHLELRCGRASGAVAPPVSWIGRRGGDNSPDNLGHNAAREHAQSAQAHNAQGVGIPKMPGEPPRVQPSRAKRPTSGDTT